MKKVGILGAYGSVGRYALKYLSETGKYEIYATGRHISNIQEDYFFSNMKQVLWVELDVTDTNALEQFVSDKDVIVNTVSCLNKYSYHIAELCMQCNTKYVDAGAVKGYETINANNGSLLYGTGALPGFSAVLAIYFAQQFSQIESFQHITSMEGVFSKGAAYDYLNGIMLDKSNTNNQPMERKQGVEIPFIGNLDLNQYIDSETTYVKDKLGCPNVKHFVSLGNSKLKTVVEKAMLIFRESPEEAVKQLIDFSQMYHIKSKEHMAYIIDGKGTDKNGATKESSLVLKFASALALTGTITGLCAGMLADATEEIGVINFSHFADCKLYEMYIPRFIAYLQDSEYTHMFEIYKMGLDDLKQDDYGEI